MTRRASGIPAVVAALCAFNDYRFIGRDTHAEFQIHFRQFQVAVIHDIAKKGC